MKIFCIFFLRVKSVFRFKFHKIRKRMRSSCSQRVFRSLRMINWFKRFACNKFYVSLIKNLLKQIFIFWYWNFQNCHAWRYINHDHKRCIFSTFSCKRRCMLLNRSRSVDSTKWNFAYFCRINWILHLMKPNLMQLQSYLIDQHLIALFRLSEWSAPNHRSNSMHDKCQKFLTWCLKIK